MSPWACCSLEEEILTILDTDSPATVRYLCALVFPALSWHSAQAHVAEAVRRHCRFLQEHHLIAETATDTFAVVRSGTA